MSEPDEATTTATTPCERPRFRKRTRLFLVVITCFGLWSWFELFFPDEDVLPPLALAVDPRLPTTEPVPHPFRGEHRLAGTVRDPAGLGRANLWVHLHLIGTSFLAETVTDDDGHFAFADMPAGEATLIVGAPGFEPKEFGPFALRPGEVAQANVVVEPRREPVVPIQDPVVDVNGRPGPRGVVEGHIQPRDESVVIELAPSDPLVRGTRRRQVIEAGTGTYRFAGVLPGSYDLDVFANRPGTDPRLRLGRLENVPVHASETSSQDIVLPLLPVRGQVLDEARQPIAGALVLAFHRRTEGENAYAGRVRTGDDGRFLLPRLPPGGLWFHVLRDGYTTARMPATLTTANEVHETVIILYRLN